MLTPSLVVVKSSLLIVYRLSSSLLLGHLEEGSTNSLSRCDRVGKEALEGLYPRLQTHIIRRCKALNILFPITQLSLRPIPGDILCSTISVLFLDGR
jgi:hypothetical protein